MAPADLVTQKIVQRYAHPERKAYLYMFRLNPGSEFSSLVPAPESVLAAWVDEGSGLLPAAAGLALAACAITLEVHIASGTPKKLTPHERRQQMARSVLFTVQESMPDLIEVRLISRALAFSPKGDREAHEHWQRSGSDWYSAYHPERD